MPGTGYKGWRRSYGRDVTGLRRLFVRRRWLAPWLLAATLAVRVLVPAGYMPAASGSLTLMICSGHMAAETMTVPMPGMVHHDDGSHGSEHDKSDQVCPFAGLAMPSVAGPDQPAMVAPSTVPGPLPLALLADARAPPRRLYLQPPLRGPPSLG